MTRSTSKTLRWAVLGAVAAVLVGGGGIAHATATSGTAKHPRASVWTSDVMPPGPSPSPGATAATQVTSGSDHSGTPRVTVRGSEGTPTGTVTVMFEKCSGTGMAMKYVTMRLKSGAAVIPAMSRDWSFNGGSNYSGDSVYPPDTPGYLFYGLVCGRDATGYAHPKSHRN